MIALFITPVTVTGIFIINPSFIIPVNVYIKHLVAQVSWTVASTYGSNHCSGPGNQTLRAGAVTPEVNHRTAVRRRSSSHSSSSNSSSRVK